MKPTKLAPLGQLTMIRRSAMSRYPNEFFLKARNRKSTVIQWDNKIEWDNKNRLSKEDRAGRFLNCRSYRMWFEGECH